MTAHAVVRIPGDGIGPSVTAAAAAVMDAAGVEIAWDVRPAGSAVADATGEALPADTVEAIRSHGVALKGPTSTGTAGGRAVSVRLRAALGLQLGIRPCRSWAGVAASAPGLDILILRMTGEDLYAGWEFEAADPAAVDLRAALRGMGHAVPPDTAFSLKPMSTAAMQRFAAAAVEYAHAADRQRITIVHKATVMRATDARFVEIVREAAARFGDLAVEDQLIDTACLKLVRHPERFDTIIAPVMYGDILADLVAGLSGGIGLAPGANLGPGVAVFEAVHGTAPALAGSDHANPLAAILSGAMLLRYLGEADAADRVEAAVGRVLADGRIRTYDQAGWTRDDPRAATTAAMTEAVIEALATDRQAGGSQRPVPLAVG
jgi:isocitrate dehydrogenase (NAD+)